MNSFGRIFRISILGESHGPAVGVVIDGCPAGIPISPDDFEFDLGRRKSGAKGTTPRTEEDLPNLVSGLFNGYQGNLEVIRISGAEAIFRAGLPWPW